MEDLSTTWSPDFTTTEDSFRGLGGSNTEELLAQEFIHNLTMARGKLPLNRVLDIVRMEYDEVNSIKTEEQ